MNTTKWQQKKLNSSRELIDTVKSGKTDEDEDKENQNRNMKKGQKQQRNRLTQKSNEKVNQMKDQL